MLNFPKRKKRNDRYTYIVPIGPPIFPESQHAHVKQTTIEAPRRGHRMRVVRKFRFPGRDVRADSRVYTRSRLFN